VEACPSIVCPVFGDSPSCSMVVAKAWRISCTRLRESPMRPNSVGSACRNSPGQAGGRWPHRRPSRGPHNLDADAGTQGTALAPVGSSPTCLPSTRPSEGSITLRMMPWTDGQMGQFFRYRPGLTTTSRPRRRTSSPTVRSVPRPCGVFEIRHENCPRIARAIGCRAVS
jgi:hypothetical protein